MLGTVGLAIWALVRSWLTPATLFVLLNIVIGTIAVTSKGFLSRPRREHHEETAKLARASSMLERLRSVGLYRYRSGEVPLDTIPAYNLEGSDGPHEEPPKLARAPSVLERLRSVSLHRYLSGEVPLDTTPAYNLEGSDGPHDEPPKLARAPSVLERLRSIGLYRNLSGEVPLEATSPPAPSSEVADAHAQAQTHDHHFGRSQSESRSKTGETNLAAWMKKSASARSAIGHFEEAEIVQSPLTARAAPREEEEEVDARADDFINRFRQQLRLQRLDSIMRYTEMLNRGRS